MLIRKTNPEYAELGLYRMQVYPNLDHVSLPIEHVTINRNIKHKKIAIIIFKVFDA